MEPSGTTRDAMYHIGRYQPPPPAPALPGNLDTAVPMPRPGDRYPLRVPELDLSEQQFKDELRLLHDLQARRTPASEGWANYMNRRGATSMWWGAAHRMRDNVGFTKGWAGTAVMAGGAVASQVAAATRGRDWGVVRPVVDKLGLNKKGDRWQRMRPYEVDPNIKLVGSKPLTTSYPSGHTRQAYTMATIVAKFDPSQADEAFKAAREVGIARLYAGAHFPSDVAAGAKFGVAVGDATLKAAKPVAVAAALGGVALLSGTVDL